MAASELPKIPKIPHMAQRTYTPRLSRARRLGRPRRARTRAWSGIGCDGNDDQTFAERCASSPAPPAASVGPRRTRSPAPGLTLVLVGRDGPRVEDTVQSVRSAAGQARAQVEGLVADLSLQSEVRRLARKLRGRATAAWTSSSTTRAPFLPGARRRPRASRRRWRSTTSATSSSRSSCSTSSRPAPRPGW